MHHQASFLLTCGDGSFKRDGYLCSFYGFYNPPGWQLKHMDEFIDELLTSDYCCDVALPHLPKRMALEVINALPPRISGLEGLEDEDEEEEEEEDEEDEEEKIDAMDVDNGEKENGEGDKEEKDDKKTKRDKEEGSPARDKEKRKERDDDRGRRRSVCMGPDPIRMLALCGP